MEKPQQPDNESQRLQVLHSLNILDTNAESRFDRITRVARRLFDVPIALVTLVDENRQWFKSCIGIDATETDREISFCGHAILSNKILLINDTLKDERFFDNPLVVGDPHIRFYAGCPLVVNGLRLGTLCIVDRIPRVLDSEDLSLLKDLAIMVEREMSAVQLATLDELTGVSNRRGFIALAQHCLTFSRRNQFPVSLVFIDLNYFKLINDSFGHEEGDKVLKDFAALIKSTFRESDVIARMGGDEFVLLMNNIDKAQTQAAIKKFITALADYNKRQQRPYNVDFSHGIVQYDAQRHENIDALMADADSLMYELKKNSR